MGLETAAIVMATIAGAAEVGKAASQIAGASAREDALEMQGRQAEIQSQQKLLQNYDIMEKVLDAQMAHMTTTGTAFSSPSFNAAQRHTLNIGAKKGRTTELEGELAKYNVAVEKQNVKNTLYAQLFGDVAETAGAAFNTYSKAPKATPQLEEY